MFSSLIQLFWCIVYKSRSQNKGGKIDFLSQSKAIESLLVDCGCHYVCHRDATIAITIYMKGKPTVAYTKDKRRTRTEATLKYEWGLV